MGIPKGDYHKGVAGEFVLPRMADAGGYYFQRCDCGLVHRLDFTITEEHGWRYASRN
jgi:hypothetical protein